VDRGVSARGVPGERSLLVKAGVLIDGTGGAAARGVDVLITGREIVSVGPRGSVKIPPGAVEIDASDGTLIPGLVDCHLHVTYSGHVGMQELEWPNSLEFSAINAGANASLALACG
jgi:imidazolonepropionase-like amidohydrolase